MAKFTPARADKFLRLIEQGNTVINAAKAVGVNPSTIYDWRKRDADFRRRLRRAEAKAEVKAVALIHLAAETDWRVAAWFLSRRFPKRWGGRIKLGVVDVCGKGPPAEHLPDDHAALDHRLRTVRDRYAAAGGTVFHLPPGSG